MKRERSRIGQEEPLGCVADLTAVKGKGGGNRIGQGVSDNKAHLTKSKLTQQGTQP